MFPWKKTLLASNILLMTGVLLSPLVSGKRLAAQPREGRHMLGCIYDGAGRVRYYVVTEFERVQAAQQVHGHSRVLFLSPRQHLVAQYELSLPEELPDHMAQNTLFFGQGLIKGHQHQQRIGTLLPPSLCVTPNNCYPKALLK